MGRETFQWLCNVHSDFTKLKYCTDNIKRKNKFLKKIHFITLIREPEQRYVSEWIHVKNEARLGVKLTFNAKNICNREV